MIKAEQLLPGSGIQIILQINNPSMTVNGMNAAIDPDGDAAPVIINGRTFLPISSIVENFGGMIKWDEHERKITIQVKNKIVELWIDQKVFQVNGQRSLLDVVPQIINAHTFLPLRFIANVLGADVNWDESSQKVTLTYKR